MKCLIAFILMSLTAMNAQHKIPEIIRTETETALSFYPQLKDTKIELKFKKNIKKSTMQARPTFGSFFRSRKNRTYIILISETFKISDTTFLTKNIPSDILIGWIGHELGHVMDYQDRNKLNLMWFGIKYLLSDNHIVEAERAADGFAVKHGMEDYILKTKDFILNHAKITPTYKDRIKRYYLSPEEIMEMVKERDALITN